MLANVGYLSDLESRLRDEAIDETTFLDLDDEDLEDEELDKIDIDDDAVVARPADPPVPPAPPTAPARRGLREPV